MSAECSPRMMTKPRSNDPIEPLDLTNMRANAYPLQQSRSRMVPEQVGVTNVGLQHVHRLVAAHVPP
jgi:hypothetical protein